MKPKHYIVWSSNKDLDVSDPYIRKWYTKQVLIHGLSDDIATLDWDYIKDSLNDLDLPEDIRNFWSGYFHDFKNI